MSDQHIYRAYGLIVRSEMDMNELVPADPADTGTDIIPDIEVRYGSVPMAESYRNGFSIDRDGDEIRLCMEDVGGVLIRAGRELIVDPAPGAEEKGFRFLASGMGLGLALHQRGFLPLHASAVAIDGGAVGFMGYKGMGKSTTAAALHARGYPVVTDDMLAVTFDADGDRIGAAPAFPHLKLMPESVSASFGSDPDPLPRVHPDSPKRTHQTESGFRQDYLPLRCIYILGIHKDETAAASVQDMSQKDACLYVMSHSLILRLLNQKGASAEHLGQCAHLVRTVPVRRLIRPHDLGRLSEIVETVEADLRRAAGSTAESIDQAPATT